MNNQPNLVFVNHPISIAEPHQPPILIPCIGLHDRATGVLISIPRLERWYVPFASDGGMASNTLAKKAFTICTFLNYLLEHTDISALHEVTTTIIRQFYIAYKQLPNGAPRDPESWIRGIDIVTDFLSTYYRSNVGAFIWGYFPEELSESVTFRDKRGHTQIRTKSFHFGVLPPQKKSRKNRYLVHGYLSLILGVMKIYDPMCALAVALQAYAGLREGEVVNLTWARIREISTGYGRIGKIELDLSSESDHASHSKKRTSFGNIKKNRVQEVFPDFIPDVIQMLGIHEDLLIAKGLPHDLNDPLFWDKWGRPMSVNTYRRRIKEVFTHRFLPLLEKQTLEDGTWAEHAPFVEAYREDYPGAHMFRHWFTMYLLEVAHLTREEISHWRGDACPDSMDDYIHANSEMCRLYRDISFSFQSDLFEVIR